MGLKLNEVQQKIVCETEGPVMVLAGAGSGKTRVLTHRIAHILSSNLASPFEILAITFTNKAANEIKNRLFLMGIQSSDIWAMTFHSMCCKILRMEASYLMGYTSSFSIFDEQDKKSVIKKILKEDNLKEDSLMGEVSEKISKYKMSNMSLEEYGKLTCFTEHDKIVFEVIKKYENRMRAENAMDFDDLINKTLYLLKTNPLVREKYQHHFRYILVDEFQDTNETQYELVKILGGYHKNVFAVGDEDQSIYSWRGASIDNIKRFLNDFSGAKLFKLEQNYRSTKNIIQKANQIIKNNKNRIDKTLFTENEAGNTVVFNKVYSDSEEADYVTKAIIGLVADKGYKYSDIAVLMRLNALTRNFEEKFVAYDIPYKIFGGLKFYERAEIKNVMAYLKILINPSDEESFLRIVNFPKRGIGDGAIEKLRAISYGQNLFATVLSLNDSETGVLAKFIPFKKLMMDLLSKIDKLGLFDFVQYVVDQTKILDEYTNETDEEINKKLNIGELLQNIKNYENDNPDKTIVDFLQTVALSTDIDGYEEKVNTVTLATVHSVKGLEFKVVFVIGLEERYFPIIRLDSDEDDMEEERRLMYVAITRAMERLYLTSSKTRYLYGKQNYLQVSRFVKELGFENNQNSFGYTNDDNIGTYGHLNNSPKKFSFGSSIANMMHKTTVSQNQSFVVGDRIFHTRFGIGYITSISSDCKTATIDFESFGNKTLSLEFAPIKKL